MANEAESRPNPIAAINQTIAGIKAQGHSVKGISDTHHTFGELYYHRMVLTQVIAGLRPDVAWKSKLHADGTMFNGDFIIGFNTPMGQYSYHYNLKEWERFDVKELEHAPEYDGHQPEDIERLLSLTAGTFIPEDWG